VGIPWKLNQKEIDEIYYPGNFTSLMGGEP